MSAIKLFIVDDAKLTRMGLAYLIQKTRHFKLLGEAENGREFLEKIANEEPDIVLMDISMPIMDGIEATKETLKINPDMKIVALTNYDSPDFIEPMIMAGAKGVIFKDIDFEDLTDSLMRVYKNNYCITKDIINSFQNITKNNNTKTSIELNSTQKAIIANLYDSKSIDEMSIVMDKDNDFILNEIKNLFKLTETKSFLELIIFSIKNKLLS